ncbi:transcriptional regulator [Herbidospora daliensis]|uniref:transcriptional regulator n=1 Tax=Herbidospora daliensis TaxID=295585 RepID=UPI000AF1FCF1|nr:transcriptional regulator [Herbidospora daliensis]
MLTLHTLRCAGSTTLARLAEIAGRPEPDVESELIDLAVAGLVTFEPGPFGGWGVTPAGRAAHAAWIAGELAAAGTRPAVAGALDRFLPLNAELLDLCEAWQLRPDTRVLTLLDDLDRRAEPVCADLAGALPRFGRYRERLAGALARVHAGETRYVTDDMASYHVIWFQLHEDLLLTLGIPR